MPADGSHIPPFRSTGVGIPPTRQATGEAGQALVDIPRRSPRQTRADPHDLGAALARLAQLLALDAQGPRANVPRGFYLDVLV